ncbi:RrF2 family transcriptional regulator [Euryhalocaulis caribicus]|uniref:RrF2 family transcriptional regulator n=1 Tax=Euryhalocaulis caribicus TaxID=1161401 RepID=UPI001F521459|nr:Rrf2 family transcriptional regulator [Euryhalocaulis caribicus]
MMLAAAGPDRVSLDQAAGVYGISKNHLMKVAQRLAKEGLIVASRGRGGGFLLAKEPREIRLGDVVRGAEKNLALVECFSPNSNCCPITTSCKLQKILANALEAFLDELNKFTLRDLIEDNRALRAQLGLKE